MSLPLKMISPVMSGGFRPMKARNMLDLPEPLRPKSPTNSPCLMCREVSKMTWAPP